MKRNLFNILYLLILIIIMTDVIINSNMIMKTVTFSFNLWFNNIIPSLFPFFILSELLIKFGFVEIISEILKKPIYYLFKVKKEASFVFIMSMLTGFPSSSKYVKELFLDNKISSDEASKILMFTHFSNPLFIIGTIATTFLNNQKMGLSILFAHYISNIIIGFLFRNYKPYKYIEKTNIKKAFNEIKPRENMGLILSKAIFNSFKTLFLILGIVIIFLCLTNLISYHLQLSPLKDGLLKGLFEMTQGLKYISLLNISLKWKIIISAMIISFGGISVHAQIIGILGDTNIKYLPFLIARIIHMILAGLIVYLLI